MNERPVGPTQYASIVIDPAYLGGPVTRQMVEKVAKDQVVRQGARG